MAPSTGKATGACGACSPDAIWRLLRWEPGWRGFAEWGAVIREGHGRTVRKKKAVIEFSDSARLADAAQRVTLVRE